MSTYTEKVVNSNPLVIHNIATRHPNTQPDEAKHEAKAENWYAQCPQCGNHETPPWPLKNENSSSF